MKLRSVLLDWKTLTVAAAVLLLAAAGLYQKMQAGAVDKQYRTERADRGDLVQTVSANGTLNPVTLVSVGTQVSGTVKHLYADFNDRVKAGQVLLDLDDALFAAQVRQSEANVKNARTSIDLTRANEARARALFAQEYISKQELDQAVQSRKSAEAQLELAQAQLAKDRANLGYSVIHSPVSGVIIDRTVDLGQTVAASFQTPTLFRIAENLTKMLIHSNFAEADVGQIRVGQTARFNVDAYPNRSFTARVDQIRLNSTTQQNVVTYDVVLSVANPEEILLPGMTAYVNVILAERHDVLRVPNAALRFKPAQAQRAQAANAPPRAAAGAARSVYVLHERQLVAVRVRLGITDNRYTEIVSGDLHAGDAVVVGAELPKEGGASGGMRMRVF